MTLMIHNLEHFEKVMRFARSTGQLPALLDQLWYLHTYADRSDDCPDTPPAFAEGCGQFPPPEWLPYGKATTCSLYWDYAPASWEFLLEKDGKRWFNGGLIYHGKQAGWELPNGKTIPEGYGVETFSVELTHNAARPWSVHT